MYLYVFVLPQNPSFAAWFLWNARYAWIIPPQSFAIRNKRRLLLFLIIMVQVYCSVETKTNNKIQRVFFQDSDLSSMSTRKQTYENIYSYLMQLFVQVIRYRMVRYFRDLADAAATMQFYISVPFGFPPCASRPLPPFIFVSDCRNAETTSTDF